MTEATSANLPQAENPPRRRRTPQPLGIDVARRLEALILDGTLEPGARLNEVALARRLGVSRGPVREAARALEKNGLVTVIMNRGAFVRSITLQEACDIYEINGLLFGLACSRAATSLPAAEAAALRGLVAAMDAAMACDDRDAFFAANSAFHAAILAAWGNREAQALYGQLTRKIQLLRRRSFDRSGHMQDSNAQHHAILDAILAGDAPAARRHAEAHTRMGCARFLESIGHFAADENTTTEGRTTR
ncbi:GntR family transcriptional regulator [Muricoccus radiodurans]|uniref:GntR family transcriptional regulator n=1 Tax=Muricoccus radiodurans TaxID=2231721 RepID=UPI003CF8F34D